MKKPDLKNKVGFQISFLLYSGKDTEQTINDITSIAIDYHNKNSELSNLIAIQEYLLGRGANDEDINEKIRQLNNRRNESTNNQTTLG